MKLSYITQISIYWANIILETFWFQKSFFIKFSISGKCLNQNLGAENTSNSCSRSNHTIIYKKNPLQKKLKQIPVEITNQLKITITTTVCMFWYIRDTCSNKQFCVGCWIYRLYESSYTIWLGWMFLAFSLTYFVWNVVLLLDVYIYVDWRQHCLILSSIVQLM